MAERIADFEIFPKQVLIKPVSPVLCLQAFERPEASHPVYAPDFHKPFLGAVDKLEGSVFSAIL